MNDAIASARPLQKEKGGKERGEVHKTQRKRLYEVLHEEGRCASSKEDEMRIVY